MTKKWNKESIQALLNRQDQVGRIAVERAILRIYENQTWDEQSSESTKHENGKGYTGADAGFYSSLAQRIMSSRYNEGARLTDNQINKARPGLLKYWRQLLEVVKDKESVKAEKKTRFKVYRDDLVDPVRAQARDIREGYL